MESRRGGQGGGGGGRRPRPRKVKTDDCNKAYAIFKCTSDECGKSWQSYHGWIAVSAYHEDCPECPNGGNVKVTGVVEEMDKFDVYTCPSCEYVFFGVAESPLAVKKCPKSGCGVYSAKTNEQERVGKKVTFLCGNQGCKTSWTSAFFDTEYGQRCKRCENQGRIVGTRRDPQSEEIEEGESASKSGMGRPFWRIGQGSHNIEGCDMCNKFGNCTEYNRIVLQYNIGGGGDGTTQQSTLFSQKGRPYRARSWGRGGGDGTTQQSILFSQEGRPYQARSWGRGGRRPPNNRGGRGGRRPPNNRGGGGGQSQSGGGPPNNAGGGERQNRNSRPPRPPKPNNSGGNGGQMQNGRPPQPPPSNPGGSQAIGGQTEQSPKPSNEPIGSEPVNSSSPTQGGQTDVKIINTPTPGKIQQSEPGSSVPSSSTNQTGSNSQQNNAEPSKTKKKKSTSKARRIRQQNKPLLNQTQMTTNPNDNDVSSTIAVPNSVNLPNLKNEDKSVKEIREQLGLMAMASSQLALSDQLTNSSVA